MEKTEKGTSKCTIKEDEVIPYTVYINKGCVEKYNADDTKGLYVPLHGSTYERDKNAIFPSMVVDYHWGPSTRLYSFYSRTYETTFYSDPRYLLMRGGLWSLGIGGWVILGFEKGFMAGADVCVKMSEQAEGEWVDLWIAGDDLDFKYPVNYPFISNVPADPKYNVDSGNYPYRTPLGISGMYQQATGGLVNHRPAWLPEQWHYLGRAKGQGGATLDGNNGPNLGYVPQKKYFYLLVVDTCGKTPAANLDVGEGADVSQIGLYPFLPVGKTYYHYLLIDDSKSISTAEEMKYVKDEIKRRIGSKLKFQGKNMFSVILIREPSGTEPATNAERVKFGGNLWLDASKKSAAEIQEAITDTLSFGGKHTPLAGALDDLIQDINKKKKDEYSGSELHVSIISDGYPDPVDEIDRGATPDIKYKDEVTNEIIGANGIMSKLLKLKGMADSFHLELVSLSKTEDWLTKIYRSLKDESGMPLFSFEKIGDLALRVERFSQLPHDQIPHTDCLNNLKAKADGGLFSARHRIGNNEYKRITYAPTYNATEKLRKVPIPLKDIEDYRKEHIRRGGDPHTFDEQAAGEEPDYNHKIEHKRDSYR